MTNTDAPYDIDGWRRRIPLLERVIPLNNCSQSPQTDRTRVAAEAWLESWNRDGMDWDAWMEEVRLAKAEFARLINASADEIAVTTSVSAATAGVASSIDFSRQRDRVLVSEAEFPTVGHVWLAHEKYGATVTWVPVPEAGDGMETWERALDRRTRLVSACHGWYQNGRKQDIGAIAARAHAVGAWLYVDAYQTLGTCPVDVKALDLDFLASGALKYLMGTPGIAFLYVRPELVERLHPAVTGWFGRENPFAFDARTLDWAPAAARFDTGTPPVGPAYIARAGMSIINEIGPARIQAWTDVLSQRLLDGGRERGLEVCGPSDVNRKTPSTAFRCDDSHEVEHRLRREGILASARGPVIRLAPHFYNTIRDIDTALDALARILGTA